MCSEPRPVVFRYSVKVRLELPLWKPRRPIGEVDVYLHSLLTLAVVRGECLTAHIGRFTPRK